VNHPFYGNFRRHDLSLKQDWHTYRSDTFEPCNLGVKDIARVLLGSDLLDSPTPYEAGE
jgi:hypothetical protein